MRLEENCSINTLNLEYIILSGEAVDNTQEKMADMQVVSDADLLSLVSYRMDTDRKRSISYSSFNNTKEL